MKVGDKVKVRYNDDIEGIVSETSAGWITFYDTFSYEEFEYHNSELDLVVDIPSLV